MRNILFAVRLKFPRGRQTLFWESCYQENEGNVLNFNSRTGCVTVQVLSYCYLLFILFVQVINVVFQCCKDLLKHIDLYYFWHKTFLMFRYERGENLILLWGAMNSRISETKSWVGTWNNICILLCFLVFSPFLSLVEQQILSNNSEKKNYSGEHPEITEHPVN